LATPCSQPRLRRQRALPEVVVGADWSSQRLTRPAASATTPTSALAQTVRPVSRAGEKSSRFTNVAVAKALGSMPPRKALALTTVPCVSVKGAE
jgi:hypothetical protein